MSKRKNTPISGQRMTANEIRANLILNGVKNMDIAKKLKVTPGAVTLIIYGYENSRRIQEAIAEAIHKPFQEVWGEKTA